jgi:hypothetical protein
VLIRNSKGTLRNNGIQVTLMNHMQGRVPEVLTAVFPGLLRLPHDTRQLFFPSSPALTTYTSTSSKGHRPQNALLATGYI